MFKYSSIAIRDILYKILQNSFNIIGENKKDIYVCRRNVRNND